MWRTEVIVILTLTVSELRKNCLRVWDEVLGLLVSGRKFGSKHDEKFPIALAVVVAHELYYPCLHHHRMRVRIAW